MAAAFLPWSESLGRRTGAKALRPKLMTTYLGQEASISFRTVSRSLAPEK